MTKKRVFASVMLPMLLALLLISPLTAYADGADDYTGELDSYTGLPAGWGYDNEQVVEAMSEKRVTITPTMSYDLLDKMFVFGISPSIDVFCSVADGMVTTQPVKLVLPEAINATLYQGGNAVEFDGEISEPGSYVLCVTENNGKITQPLQFTIVNSVTGRINRYPVPAGFEVTNLTCNDEERFMEENIVDLTEEGRYQITSVCSKTGEIYELSVTIDHTPPVLQLDGVENGEAHGPVTISSTETGLTVSLMKDSRLTAFSAKLTESGSYELTVADQAGNTQTYRFDIMPYLNTNSVVFLGLLVVGLIVLAVYLLRARNHVRVR